MRRAIAAVLLSALVFPGLGHLYNRDWRRGIFLILMSNLLLGLLVLLGLILLSREYYTVFYPTPLNREIFHQLFLDILTHPLFAAPLALFVGLWAFAAVDAGRGARRPAPEEQ
jgi:TM2 domain-containing membrane protein YozV